MNALAALLEQGQSIWYDFISRDFISSGEMKRLVDIGLRGMTSNPTIFEKSIADGSSYDQQIHSADTSLSTAEIATSLFLKDIRNACDILRPVYDSSDGADGFVSIEVSPKLAHHTEGTLTEVRHLWQQVARPNVMIKIPATAEGTPAIRQALSEGININITLMFSMEQYRAVAEAFLSGLEERVAADGAISGIASVASVFVSRIDAMIDAQLDTIGTPEALALRGKTGVANSRLIYQEFMRIFSGERWEAIAASGVRSQRLLWASTSTKNPSYPDLLYVDNLIGPETINTVPPDTLEAILDHVKVAQTISNDLDAARQQMESISAVGIDIDEVMNALLREGVEKFEKSFKELFARIEEKRAALSGTAAATSSATHS